MSLLIFGGVEGRAQDVTATLVGRVTDASGGVVPGAKIAVTDIDTRSLIRTSVTDGRGEFTEPLLPVGHYSVRVTATGFQAYVQTGIELNAEDRINVDAKLKPGKVDQTVTVTADALQAQTQTSASDELISGTEIRELSIPNRNYLGLLNILPGVTNTNSTDELVIGAVNPTGGVNSLGFSLNGGRVSANSFLLDGSDNLDRGANTTLINTPSVDAVAEFKVIRGVYSAEFGRNAASQINVITRSGTSVLHGDLYEFFRNDVLNANNALNKLDGLPRPELRYNDFGGAVGGPVYIPKIYTTGRNKTFFFFSEEARRIITYQTQGGALAPSANMKLGIFSGPVCLAYTTTALTTCAPGATATSLPQSSWDPVAAAYVKDVYDKLPNGAPINPAGGSLALTSQGRSTYNLHQELARIDHSLTDHESLTFRYIHDAINTVEPYGYQVNSLLPLTSTTQSQTPGQNAMIRLTSVLQSTLLNEVAFAYTSGRRYSVPIGLLAKQNATDVNVNLPFQSTVQNVPFISMTGISAASGYGIYDNHSRNFNLFDNLTWVHGRNTYKFGVTANYYQKTENNASTNAGRFSFGSTTVPNAPTGGTKAAPAEQNWANFLLGHYATFTQTSLDLTPDMRQSETEMYAQDDFRILPGLTINAGVRYSIFRQPWDARDELTNFDAAKFVLANAPTFTGTGSTILPGSGDPLNGIIVNNATSPWGQKVSNEPGGKFSPRLGAAWSPFADGRTAIRGGYGFVWDSTLVGIYENNIFTNAPYLNNLSVPVTTFANPAAGSATDSVPALRGTPLPTRLPYTSQYSFDVQQQIGRSLLVDVGYYGSKGTHLLGIADINTLHPGQYAAILEAQGVPVATASAALTTGSTPGVNRYRPFPGYTAINQVQSQYGSNYNSLQAYVQKQFGDGSTLRAAYTFQKTLTDASTDRNSAPQDHYNPHQEYAVASFNRKQIFVASYIYKIPFPYQQRFARAMLAGWEFSGTVSLDAGLSTGTTSGSGVDPAQIGVEGSSSQVALRPDQVGNANQNAPHTLLKWFNTSAFADVPSGALRLGNSKPTSFIGPGFEQWDTSVFRNFPIYDRLSGQFRVESFNVLNHDNPATVGTETDVSTGTTAFGAVTAVRDPRRIQLGLKVLF